MAAEPSRTAPSSDHVFTRRDIFRMSGIGAASLAAGAILTGCGTSSSSSSSSGSSGGPASSSRLAAYSNKNLDLFFYQVEVEAVKRASIAKGYHFDTTNANGDAGTQFNDWNTFLVQKPAFLISDPINTSNLIPLTPKAKRLGVPVAIIDSPLTGGTVDFTIAFDNRNGGVLQGQKMVQLLTKKYGRPKGTVLNTYGDLTAQWAVERKQGFDSVLNKYSDITVVERPTKTLPAQMHSVVAAALAQYPHLDGINSPTDGITIDAIDALRSAGRLYPASNPNHIIITTMDGDANGIYWINQGWVDADVSQDPIAYGEIAVEMLTKYSIHGKPVPPGEYSNNKYVWQKATIFGSDTGPRLNVPAYFINKQNANDPRQWANVASQQWHLHEPR